MAKFAAKEENNEVVKVPSDDRLDEIPDPPSDAVVKGGTVEYVYEDRGDGKQFYTARPNGDDAMAKIEERLVTNELSGYDQPIMEAMALIDRWTSAERAIERENYARYLAYMEARIVPGEDDLGQEFVDFCQDLLG